jgi:hypothetical protein
MRSGWQLAALMVAGLTAGSAHATPVTPPFVLASRRLAGVEQAQFFFGGRNFCFYPGGWHGPGFYWCGYAWRRGLGWGGPTGWRGWHGRGLQRPGPGFGHRPGRAYPLVGLPRVGLPHVGLPHMGLPRVGHPPFGLHPIGHPHAGHPHGGHPRVGHPRGHHGPIIWPHDHH